MLSFRNANNDYEFFKNIAMQGLIDMGITLHDEKTTLYKYTTFNNARKILSSNSIRFSSPVLFNDPFEMTLDLINYKISDNYKESILANIDLDEFLPLNFLPKQEREKIFGIHSNAEIEYFYKTNLEIQRSKSLILCLSRVCDDTLMWSHYADKHNGVCIGMKIPVFDLDLDLLTVNVKYLSKIDPILLNSLDKFETINAYFQWIFSKSDVWSYEKEIRACIPNTDNRVPVGDKLYYDYPFDTELVCEIYYGVGASKEQIEELEEIIKNKKYIIEKRAKMEISKGTFKVAPKFIIK